MGEWDEAGKCSVPAKRLTVGNTLMMDGGRGEMAGRFDKSEEQSPATFTHGRRSDKDIIVVEAGTRT